MRSILLSFEPYWFDRMAAGMKFEYRKNFPKEPVRVYFYVSSPVKAISGIAHFGNRERLSDWLVKYADRGPEVRAHIEDFMQDCNYAIPMHSFQLTNKLSLEQLRRELSRFIVPRMYCFIPEDSELQRYLDANLKPIGKPLIHTFEHLADEDICR